MIQRAAIRVVVEPRPDGGCDVVGEGFYCLAMFARASRKPRPTLEAVLDHALNACLDRLPAPPPVGSLVAYLAETYFGFATNRSTR